eukprot:2116151-Pyramimonas_sp.AAC.1
MLGAPRWTLGAPRRYLKTRCRARRACPGRPICGLGVPSVWAVDPLRRTSRCPGQPGPVPAAEWRFREWCAVSGGNKGAEKKRRDPNIHLGAPNIHLGAPNIHFGAPKIHLGAPNIHLGAPNIHLGASNIHIGKGKLRIPKGGRKLPKGRNASKKGPDASKGASCDWSVTRIYLHFLRPIGPSREHTRASCVRLVRHENIPALPRRAIFRTWRRRRRRAQSSSGEKVPLMFTPLMVTRLAFTSSAAAIATV